MDSAVGAVEPLLPPEREKVLGWIRDNAAVITTVDPSAPLEDVEPLGAWIEGADVVGLGESVRGVRSGRELYQLKHRLTRLLVQKLGFRTVALEDMPVIGSALDHFVRTGDGDPERVLDEAWGPWRTEEFADLVRWLRLHNAAHPDDLVRVVGVDGSDANALARNTLRCWQELGRRVVYWGGMAHVAVHGDPSAPAGEVSDGWVLRDQLGHRYVAVGITCHHGIGVEEFPPPPDYFAESLLGAAGIGCFALDARTAPASNAARSWLTSPTATRLIGPRYEPDHDSDYAMTGGTLQGWFDLLVHVRQITPAHSLSG